MKKVMLFSAIIFLLTPQAFAEVTEGKSTVNTSVTTNVNTSSNNSTNNSETKTHIEIEVNGEKKVLDTNEPGTHTLSIEKEGGKSSASVNISNNSSSSSKDDEDGKAKALSSGEIDDAATVTEKTSEQNQTIVQKIIEGIKEFFQNLFDF